MIKMADFTVSTTIPDNKVTELVAALRDYFGKNTSVEPPVDYTIAELKTLFANETKRQFRVIYVDYMKSQATEPVLGES